MYLKWFEITITKGSKSIYAWKYIYVQPRDFS